MEFDLAQLRLESAPFRGLEWINANMVDYAIREILDPLRDLSASRGHSQRFRDGWTVEKTGWLRIELVNDFEFADLLEFGWGDYDVYPLGKENGGADFLHWTDSSGDHFASHTHPRGFRGYHLLDSMENWGFYDRFLEKLLEDASNYLMEMRMR